MVLGVPVGMAYKVKFCPFAAAIIMQEESDLHPLLG